jgi:hypothetical protein
MSQDNALAGFESKSYVSFEEFRAWLLGLIQGKKGVLPDIDDWKLIKKMLDKVDPTIDASKHDQDAPKIVPIPLPVYPSSPPPIYPCPPYYAPYTSPGTGDFLIGDNTSSKWETFSTVSSYGVENKF